MTVYNFKFDHAHSQVAFVARHMMFAKVRGKFDAWEGELLLDTENPSNSSVHASIESASVNTGVEERDKHLRSDDFFNTEEYPTIEFRSTAFERSSEGYRVRGNLTIRGVTKPLTLEVENLGKGVDPWGNTRIGLSVRGKVNRKDFGLTWNQALEAGGVLVGDEVAIEIDVQAVQGEKVSESAA